MVKFVKNAAGRSLIEMMFYLTLVATIAALGFRLFTQANAKRKIVQFQGQVSDILKEFRSYFNNARIRHIKQEKGADAITSKCNEFTDIKDLGVGKLDIKTATAFAGGTLDFFMAGGCFNNSAGIGLDAVNLKKEVFVIRLNNIDRETCAQVATYVNEPDVNTFVNPQENSSGFKKPLSVQNAGLGTLQECNDTGNKVWFVFPK